MSRYIHGQIHRYDKNMCKLQTFIEFVHNSSSVFHDSRDMSDICLGIPAVVCLTKNSVENWTAQQVKANYP